MPVFSSSKKPIKLTVRKALKKVPGLGLNRSRRREVEKVLGKYSSRGITKMEIKKAVRQMKNDTKDGISRGQADKIKRSLLKRK